MPRANTKVTPHYSGLMKLEAQHILID